jgi:hypothetical protein
MCARILAATFCCALGCLPVVGADSSGTAASELVVYLTARATPSTLPFARREAESLMLSAGYAVEWRASRDPQASAASLVMVEFAGDCAAPATPLAPASSVDSGRSLATTAVQDGAVLPFTRIDCGALRGVLGTALDREAPARRTFLLGRAMGRLVAHELYHALARTRDHAAAGIGKPCFTAADLLSERFEFEAVALNRLRHSTPDATFTDDSGDRDRP